MADETQNLEKERPSRNPGQGPSEPVAPDGSGKEPKILVDEDWKSRVEAERQTARGSEEAAKPSGPEPEENLPPPSLTYLAGTLYIQGAVAMGLLPHPISGKSEVHLGRARHAIDTLQVLQDKTEGNRTPEESGEIEAVLHLLRMAYVELKPR